MQYVIMCMSFCQLLTVIKYVINVKYFILKECAKRIAKVSAEAKLETDEENYLNSFRPNLMDVVYTWANGANFAHICKMTDVFEGRLISCSLESNSTTGNGDTE